jgi:hypothetical protein
VDFWLLTDDPFDRSRFGRRRVAEILGQRIAVSTPEDTILMKLRWAAESGSSERQLGDARHVYELNKDAMDIAYIESWAERLGVTGLLDEIRP